MSTPNATMESNDKDWRERSRLRLDEGRDEIALDEMDGGIHGDDGKRISRPLGQRHERRRDGGGDSPDIGNEAQEAADQAERDRGFNSEQPESERRTRRR